MWKDGFCKFKNELNICYKYAVLNPILLPICPKLPKEGEGQIANQKVLNLLSQIESVLSICGGNKIIPPT